MEEIKEYLTDDKFDEFVDNYSRCINSWIGEDWFIGIIKDLPETAIDSVYHVSALSIPTDDNKDLIRFKQFFDEHDLWSFIDWKPELLLINFCY